ncbi:hypothetical protein [Anaeromyxobacter diazotrophicus]|uniref:Uncharacterized protein n=1 Tax=Anaeromyxobacter diazotrophicus TaxID=2590199 RepID=A0A7I9VSC3_9BACT|nr:hypothetical protein [Anaeromyxobacter diazotrophicus]GEJ59118.1 hypothetical protein AMYX_38590 [Anaeromyxobacter diazotrophicus]
MRLLGSGRGSSGPPRRRLRAVLLGLLAAAACGGGAPAYDAGIDGAYLVQSSQDYAGTVPLVQGRAGLLRVFLSAKLPGLAAPAVRARLYDAAGALLQTYAATAQPPPTALPAAVSEASLAGSWNFAIPAADVQPGRYLVAEIDPVAGVPASRTRTSFRYPASGTLDVRAVPAVAITVVPVVQAPAGLTPLEPLVAGVEPAGGVRTVDGWLDRARRIHPLSEASAALGATYTTSTVLGADGSGWSALLAELEQKRVVDGSPNSYLGAVRVSYTSGTAGIAYALSARRPASVLVWDAGSTPDNPLYQKAAAHEVGHLLGLLHAPCGIPPATADTGWPTGPTYAGAHIGVFGWDPLDGSVKDPASVYDLMSYCGRLETTWTSDYGYRRVLSFLGAVPATATATASRAATATAVVSRQPCLVVAGRVREGKVEVEPAYAVDTIPSAVSPGEYEFELVDGAGATLSSVAFAPAPVAAEREGEAEERHFALAVPLARGWADAVRGLVVRERGAVVYRRALAVSPGAVAVAAAPVAVRAASRRHAQLSWDAAAHPGALVRDARTGEVLAFLRGGAGVVQTAAPELEVVLSDDVSASHRVVVAP